MSKRKILKNNISASSSSPKGSHKRVVFQKTQDIIKVIGQQFPEQKNKLQLLHRELAQTFVYKNTGNPNKKGSLSNTSWRDGIITNKLFAVFYQDLITSVEQYKQTAIQDLFYDLHWQEFDQDNVSEPYIVHQSDNGQTIDEILYTVRRLKKHRNIYSQYRNRKINLDKLLV